MTSSGNNGGGGASIFRRCIADTLEADRPAEPEIVQRGPLLPAPVLPAKPKSHPAEKLLDWLWNHWTQPTISERNVRIYGPRSVRSRDGARGTAEILVKRGWLEPLETRRRDMKAWRIARGPGSSAAPP